MNKASVSGLGVFLTARYVPDRGHIIWIDFIPQSGHEQAGRRPAVVLSPLSYNRIGLSLCCPVTNRSKGYPFEVILPRGLPIGGVVLADQVKNVDWQARNAEFIGKVTSSLVHAIVDRILTLSEHGHA